jgi:hypothetical protein
MYRSRTVLPAPGPTSGSSAPGAPDSEYSVQELEGSQRSCLLQSHHGMIVDSQSRRMFHTICLVSGFLNSFCDNCRQNCLSFAPSSGVYRISTLFHWAVGISFPISLPVCNGISDDSKRRIIDIPPNPFRGISWRPERHEFARCQRGHGIFSPGNYCLSGNVKRPSCLYFATASLVFEGFQSSGFPVFFA